MTAKRNSNLLCRTFLTKINACDTGIYAFMNKHRVTSVPKKNIDYKGPRLIKGSKRWYVEFYYRIPDFLYEGRKWERFRVFGELNRVKTNGYAQEFLAGVENALTGGFNPFNPENKERDELLSGLQPKKDWTVLQAINFFHQKWNERGLESVSLDKYSRATDILIQWLSENSMQQLHVDKITTDHIELALNAARKKHEWGNRHYNNIKDLLRTVWKFLVKKKIAQDNVVADIDKLKTKTTKHRYYNDEVLEKVINKMKAEDPYLYFASQVVYQLCIRSEKELSLFKVGNIIPERKQVFIEAEDSKTDMDRYIPMSDEILNVFKERKILDYPKDYFVFTSQHKNKFVKDGEPGPKPFGRGFFSKRFSRIRAALGLSSDYTIYSFRHTRCVHLKMDGASDQQIMALMGHTDFATTAKYLRDLGLTVDPDAINKKSRKF